MGRENEEDGNQLKSMGNQGIFDGGADQDRTGDLLNAIQGPHITSFS